MIGPAYYLLLSDFWGAMSWKAITGGVLMTLASVGIIGLLLVYGKRRTRHLYIQSATWGAGTVRQDVLPAIRNQLFEDHLTLSATNEELGCDPCMGTGKQLIVRYSIGRESHQITLPEGHRVAFQVLSNDSDP